MKLHPLHTIEFVAQCLGATGEYPGERMTGRTTAAALAAIAAAIRNPGTPVVLKDHHDADRHLCDVIKDIIAKLELRSLHVEYGPSNRYYQLIFKHKD